ncbi:MAG: PKD domain-containing protein [bacterium]|nr:PKD domain-containing protein [bacterium]
MKQKIAAIVLGLTLATPLFAGAATLAEIQQQIANLLAQITQLQQQLQQLQGAGVSILAASPSSGEAPLVVTFSATSTASTTLSIDFGDGGTGTPTGSGALTLNHTYTSNGTYTAKLISNNATLSSLTIRVGAASSTTLSALPSSGAPPLAVSFSSNTSGGTIDFGDGGSGTMTPTSVCATCSPVSTAAHTYAAAGTYIAKLTSGSVTSSVTITVATGGTSSCTAITHDLAKGDTDADVGGDVTTLQQFLAQDPVIYPEGLVTGFFGRATESAVKRFQKKWNISQTGVVGPLTRSAIENACDGEGPSVIGTSEYKFKAKPRSGTAPLTVKFSAIALQTEGDVGKLWYTVDFGDDTSDTMKLGASSTLSVSHVYTYTDAGTSTAKLFQNEDLCGLDGQTFTRGCTRQLQIDSVPIRVTGLKKNTLFVAPTSGAAPLNVTAKFQLGSSCSHYTLTWGDGDNSSVTTSKNGCEKVDPKLSSIKHTYLSGGTYTVTFKVGANGPVQKETVKVTGGSGGGGGGAPCLGAPAVLYTSGMTLDSYKIIKQEPIQYGSGTIKPATYTCTNGAWVCKSDGHTGNTSGSGMFINARNPTSCKVGTSYVYLNGTLVDLKKWTPPIVDTLQYGSL